jgi:hypothetical protein
MVALCKTQTVFGEVATADQRALGRGIDFWIMQVHRGQWGDHQ